MRTLVSQKSLPESPMYGALHSDKGKIAVNRNLRKPTYSDAVQRALTFKSREGTFYGLPLVIEGFPSRCAHYLGELPHQPLMALVNVDD